MSLSQKKKKKKIDKKSDRFRLLRHSNLKLLTEAILDVEHLSLSTNKFLLILDLPVSKITTHMEKKIKKIKNLETRVC